MAAGEYVILFGEAETVYRKLTDEQFGILIRAVLAYRLRGERYNGEDIRVDQAFESFSNQVDREAEIRVKRSRAAKKRWDEDVQEDAMQTDANDAPIHSSPIQSIPDQSNPVQSSPIEENKDSYTDNNKRVRHGAAASTREHKKCFGQFGWVKLSLAEYDALAQELGEAELLRCITYLDESAQITGNKNRWKDFGLVIRKCSREKWGLDRKQSKDDFWDDNPYEGYQFGTVL